MNAGEVKALLQALNFPPRCTTEQTAFCILALADDEPRQGLLPGHASLADGARIHDILGFVRLKFERPVAENTRESYRKTSLRPLMESGWIVRHQLSTNDPNTYYRLHPDFARLFALHPGAEREALMERLRLPERRRSGQRPSPDQEIRVILSPERTYPLSPGQHSLLEKAVVEVLGPALVSNPRVVYLGDTARRTGYQDRALMRQLNLLIDVSVSLPDVILFSAEEQVLLVVEALASSGPITPSRLAQLQGLVADSVRLGLRASYISAFPSRKVFRRFVEEIAWGSEVWIADEPYNIIHFVAITTNDDSQRG